MIYTVTMTLQVDAETEEEAKEQGRAELAYPNDDSITIEVS